MSIKKPTSLPLAPGIYCFKKAGRIIYVGKAANIKKRLASYFRKDISGKVKQLMREATALEWIETKSETEALLKEAELIKKNIPKYNVVMRDDKNYFYVGFTKEKYPRVFLTHQPHQKKQKALGTKKLEKISLVGPFTSGTALKAVLHMLRKIFPFCTCKETHQRPCVNTEIGKCPGYCCFSDLANERTAGVYRDTIHMIAAILSGRKKRILGELKKEMKQEAARGHFERAAIIRDQIFGLENIFSHTRTGYRHTLKNANLYRWEKIEKNIRNLIGVRQNIHRVEGYDISNISGAEATGSMVVFFDGRASPKDYRMFKIKMKNVPNDVAMHKEVLSRRLSHEEWPFPELLVIDGGIAQRNVALFCIRERGRKKRIAVAALAKREEELYLEGRALPIRLSTLPPETAFFFQRVRNESHRFAKKYHLKRRELRYRNL